MNRRLVLVFIGLTIGAIGGKLATHLTATSGLSISTLLPTYSVVKEEGRFVLGINHRPGNTRSIEIFANGLPESMITIVVDSLNPKAVSMTFHMNDKGESYDLDYIYGESPVITLVPAKPEN